MFEDGKLYDHFDGNVHGTGCRQHVHLVPADSTQVSEDTNGDEATIPREDRVKDQDYKGMLRRLQNDLIQ